MNAATPQHQILLTPQSNLPYYALALPVQLPVQLVLPTALHYSHGVFPSPPPLPLLSVASTDAQPSCVPQQIATPSNEPATDLPTCTCA